jgi:hypothetical protein
MAVDFKAELVGLHTAGRRRGLARLNGGAAGECQVGVADGDDIARRSMTALTRTPLTKVPLPLPLSWSCVPVGAATR